MSNTWLMKAFKDWAIMFTETNKPFIAIDEEGFSVEYGSLSEAKRSKLISDVKKLRSDETRQWGKIKRFFGEFYDEMLIDDLVVIGIGSAVRFKVHAIVRVIGNPYYVHSHDSWNARHRRDVEILWQGEPIDMQVWSWANRLDKLDNPERLQQFISMYSQVTHPKALQR